jgi:SAM-dependent methyltransferase
MSERRDREREFFDGLAERHGYAWWGSQTAAGQRREKKRAQFALAWLDLRPGRRVLEIGCSTGGFSRHFAATGADIVATDVSPKLIELARGWNESPNLRFEVEDAAALSFPDGSFDAVMGNAILHHLDLTVVLPELRRVLRGGGRVYFAEPNMLNPHVWTVLNVAAVRRRQKEISPDETAFCRWRLHAAFAEHGFEDVTVRPFDFLHPATPMRMIPLVERLERCLERTVLREIAGSLQVTACRR